MDRADTVRPFLAARGLKTMLDIGGSTGVVAAHFARRVRPARHADRPGAARGGPRARARPRDHHGAGRDPRFRRRPVRRRADLPDRSITCSTSAARCGGSGTCSPTGGFLFVDIVDFRAAYLRNWSVEDATKIDHPYYLTQETMQAYLRRAGFAIVARGLRGRPPARQLSVPARRTRAGRAAGTGGRGRALSRSALGAERAAARLIGRPPSGVLAIVPARGGSKGVPGKNLRPLAGRLLIEYAAEAARAIWRRRSHDAQHRFAGDRRRGAPDRHWRCRSCVPRRCRRTTRRCCP